MAAKNGVNGQGDTGSDILGDKGPVVDRRSQRRGGRWTSSRAAPKPLPRRSSGPSKSRSDPGRMCRLPLPAACR